MTPVNPPSQGLNAAVAAELRAERAAAQLTVQQLADLSEVPYATLRRYLNSQRHMGLEVLEAVCATLDVEPSVLVQRAIRRMEKDAKVIRPSFGAGRKRDEMLQIEDEAAWDE